MRACVFRLKATARVSGTLRVTRVPYEEGDDKYDEAVALFDKYSGSYPICGKLRVRGGRLGYRFVELRSVFGDRREHNRQRAEFPGMRNVPG